MGQLITAAGGAYIGSFFGPIGAQVGWAVGSLVGGAIFNDDQVIPGRRLDEIRTQQSSYGIPIPIVYGRCRIPGILIDQSERREQRVEREAGKGGGPTQEEIYYYIDLLFMLTRNELTGIGRVWRNKKLFMDARTGEVFDPVTETSAFIRRIQEIIRTVFNVRYEKFYPGSQTQEVDPTFEALRGASMPAYLGRSLFRFENHDISDIGAAPNFEFEVFQSGTLSDPEEILAQEDPIDDIVYYTNAGGIVGDSCPVIVSVVDGVITVAEVSYGSPNVAVRRSLFSLDGQLIHHAPSGAGDGQFGGIIISTPTYDMYDWVMTADNGNTVKANINPQYGSGDTGGIFLHKADSLQEDGWFANLTDNGGILQDILRDGSGRVDSSTFLTVVPCADNRHFFVEYLDDTSTRKFMVIRVDPLGATVINFGDNDTTDTQDAVGSARANLYSTNAVGMMESDMQHVWIFNADSVSAKRLLKWIDPDDNTLKLLADIDTDNAAYGSETASSIYADNGMAYFVCGRGNVSIYTRLPLLTGAAPTLEDVLTDIADRRGYDASEFDFSAAAGTTVESFPVLNQADGVAAVQTLRQSYFFDLIQSGAQIKCVMRGGASAFEIEEDDLGAAPPGQQSPIIVTEREDPRHLPRAVTVKYLSLDRDYQQASQTARRHTVVSTREIEVNLATAHTDAQAMQIATTLLDEAHLSNVKLTFPTWRKWAHLEPADVGTVTARGVTYTCRITEKRQPSAAVFEFDALLEEPSLYTNDATPGDTSGGSQTITSPGMARLELADVHPLREQDDELCIYAGACNYGETQSGVRLYRSTDGGATYALLDGITEPSIIGTCASVLGDYTGGNIVDEANYVDVDLAYGEPASTTNDGLLEGDNFALVGDELIQFRTVTDQGGTRRRLSGLLRGRRGTQEYNSTHDEHERFLLLDESAMIKIPMSVTDIGTTALYKAQAIGSRTPLADIEAQSLTFEGNSLKPLPPANVVGTWLTNGDVLIRWNRSSRLYPYMLNGSANPLDETAEQYEVDILDATGTTVLRTSTTLTSAQYTYTAANQATDFGAAQVTYQVRVYQLSSTVDRGRPAEVQIDQFTGTWSEDFSSADASKITNTVGSNKWTITGGALRGTYDNGTQYEVRLNQSPNFFNGVVTFDYDWSSTSTLQTHLVLRTSFWDAVSKCAYAILFTRSGTIRVYRGTNSITAGSLTQIGADLGYGGAGTGTIRVEMIGSTFNIYADSALIGTRTDSTHSTRGQIGFISERNGLGSDFGYIDNVIVNY
jgi:hypothetical protein